MSDSCEIYDDDAEINAAIDEAQRRLPDFRRIVEADSRRLIPLLGGTLAKVVVVSKLSGAVEHLWISGVGFEGNEIVGDVITAPHEIPEVKINTELRASLSSITDWIYYEGDEAHGGFAEKILRERAQSG